MKFNELKKTFSFWREMRIPILFSCLQKNRVRKSADSSGWKMEVTEDDTGVTSSTVNGWFSSVYEQVYSASAQSSEGNWWIMNPLLMIQAMSSQKRKVHRSRRILQFIYPNLHRPWCHGYDTRCKQTYVCVFFRAAGFCRRRRAPLSACADTSPSNGEITSRRRLRETASRICLACRLYEKRGAGCPAPRFLFICVGGYYLPAVTKSFVLTYCRGGYHPPVGNSTSLSIDKDLLNRTILNSHSAMQ